MRAPEPTANLCPEGDHRTKVVARPALRSSRLDRQSRWAKRRKNLDFSQGIYRATPKAERLWHAYRGFRPSSRFGTSLASKFTSRRQTKRPVLRRGLESHGLCCLGIRKLDTLHILSSWFASWKFRSVFSSLGPALAKQAVLWTVGHRRHSDSGFYNILISP